MKPLSHYRSPRWLEPALTVAAVALALSPFLYHVMKRLDGLEFPLDDAYIYLQYARNLATGHLFEYWPGDGYTAGATSPLYPLLLVPGFWAGLRGAAMVPYVWALNALLIATCVWLAARIGRHFAGTTGALASGGMLLIHGAWLWGAMSGLEIGMFTALALAAVWLLARDARDRDVVRDAMPAVPTPGEARSPEQRSTASRPAVALGVVTALLAVARPEGMPMALVLVACVLLADQRRRRWSQWLLWSAVFVPYAAVGLLNLRFAGQFVPNTAVHKSVMYYPRQSWEHVLAHVAKRVARLATDLASAYGGRWLLPLGLLTVALAAFGLARHIWLELSRRRAFPATFLLLSILAATAAAMVAKGPGQFNRYFHVPFALLAIASGLGLAELSRRLRTRVSRRMALGLEAAVLVLILILGGRQVDRWAKIYARASAEIHDQQVKAARWIDAHLPADAYLLLNDVGAMTYLANRRSFDLCGLTTNHQAMTYHEGGGAMFEALERLDPGDRPTHLAVYPSWLAVPQLQGGRLFTAKLGKYRVVAGGTDVVVSEADWRLFGSGAKPATPLAGGQVIDALDVADLADEAAHGYVLEVTDTEHGARKTTLLSPDTTRRTVTMLDGGRPVSRGEAFDMTIPALRSANLRARLEPSTAARLEVSVDGVRAGKLAPKPEGAAADASFVEVDLALPSLVGRPGTHRIEVRAVSGKPYRVFHYWVWGALEAADRS